MINTNQGSLHESIRLITQKLGDYNGDWHALFDFYSVSDEKFNNVATKEEAVDLGMILPPVDENAV